MTTHATDTTQTLVDQENIFDPEKFFCKGWKSDPQPSKLKTGTIDGDASRATTLFVSESVLKGQDRLDVLAKSGKTHLGAEDFWFFWNNQHLIPDDWEGKIVTFDANNLLSPTGYSYFLFLHKRGGKWLCGHDWLGRNFGRDYVSAVLAE